MSLHKIMFSFSIHLFILNNTNLRISNYPSLLLSIHPNVLNFFTTTLRGCNFLGVKLLDTFCNLVELKNMMYLLLVSPLSISNFKFMGI